MIVEKVILQRALRPLVAEAGRYGLEVQVTRGARVTLRSVPFDGALHERLFRIDGAKWSPTLRAFVLDDKNPLATVHRLVGELRLRRRRR